MTPSIPSSESPVPSLSKKRLASPGAGANTMHHQRDTMSSITVLYDSQPARQDNSTVDSDTNGDVPNDSKDTSLLGLPRELLEIIASELCGSKDILKFALTNRQMNGIAQEAMIKKLVVSKKNIKQFLEMLSKHPEYIKKAKSVNLGDYGCTHHTECSCVGKPNFDPEILMSLDKAMALSTGKAIDWSHLQQAKSIAGPVWRRDHAFFLDVLAAVCPNIMSMTIELPEARMFDSSRPPRPVSLVSSILPARNVELPPVAPLQGPALQIMQEKLEALTIAEDSRWKGPWKREMLRVPQDITWRNVGKHTITLSGFTRLSRLDVPIDVLGEPKSLIFLEPTDTAFTMDETVTLESNSQESDMAKKQTQPTDKVLPLTLKYLQLRACNKWTFAFLQKVCEIPTAKVKLKYIKLFFKTCTQTAIRQCYAADEGRLNYPLILAELEKKGIKVTFHTGPKDTLVDMQLELMALSPLSALDTWRFATFSMPFSKLSVKASIKRRLSGVGGHLFIKHVEYHFQLFNSPTLDTKAWVGVGFFHGVRNTRWDPDILPRNLKVHTIDSVQWSTRPLGKCEPVRRLRILPDLSQSSFRFRNEMKLQTAPKEASFLGVTIAGPIKMISAIKRDTKTTTQSNKVDQKVPGSWQCPVGGKMSSTKKELEQDMADLQLEPTVSNTPHDRTILFEEHPRFDAEVWSGVDWRTSLGHRADNTQDPTTIDVPGPRQCGTSSTERQQRRRIEG